MVRHKLEFHIKYLEKTRGIFRKFDPENHGAISYEHLTKLLKEMKLPVSVKENDIVARTNADKLGKVTFSDLIESLTAFHVEKGSVLITVLQWNNEH
jgi:Ca2+-binding EF-hand superfamily protein